MYVCICICMYHTLVVIYANILSLFDYQLFMVTKIKTNTLEYDEEDVVVDVCDGWPQLKSKGINLLAADIQLA